MLTDGDKKEIREVLDHLESECDEKLNYKDLFKPGHVQKTLILILCWLVSYFFSPDAVVAAAITVASCQPERVSWQHCLSHVLLSLTG